ncbi:MAG: PAS domain S-box protein [Armatimonadetes bacterium]|nr:PAS domain S-box protein [Armatimonadota bacterium]
MEQETREVRERIARLEAELRACRETLADAERGAAGAPQPESGAPAVGAGTGVAEAAPAQEALCEREERYHCLFRNNRAAMLLIDPDTADIVDANPAACAFYGYTLSQLRARKITDINSLTPEEVFQEMESARSERRNHFHFRHRLASGDVRDVEVFSGPIEMEGRQLLYSLVFDVTERAQAEAGLREANERLQAVFDASPLPIIALDTQARVIAWNRAAERVFGWRAEEALDRPIPIIPPERRAQFEENWARELRGEAVSGWETTRVRKDGSRLDVSLSTALMRDARGRIVGTMGVFEDISERKRAEHELEAARRRLLQGEIEKKRFYSEVIRVVTHGRFRLVDTEDLPAGGRLALDISLEGEPAYAKLRHELRRIAEAAGMGTDRADDLVLAVGEAATNAIKHAVRGRCFIYAARDRVTARVCDEGNGIHAEDLPASILMPGFSTGISLGMGYTIMLHSVDRVWLATGPEGTVVQLEQCLTPRTPAPALESVPAAWERL